MTSKRRLNDVTPEEWDRVAGKVVVNQTWDELEALQHEARKKSKKKEEKRNGKPL